jgi:hypothetical protein
MSTGPTDPLYSAPQSSQEDPRKISVVLTDLAQGWPHERISLGDIVEGLADRGFGILMLLLALPTTLPVAPPGLSAAFGIPLAAIAVQLAWGSSRPWLPRILLRRSFAAAEFRRMINRSMPLLQRMERVLRPRLPFLTGWLQERLIGAACTVLGILLASPVPLTNIPLVFLALGLLARDGLAVIGGLAVSLGAIFFLFYMSAAAWNAIEAGLQAWF